MEEVGRERNIGDARDGLGFAVIERLDFGELIRMLEDEVADAPDEFAALARGQATPRSGFEGATRGYDGAVDVFFVALGDAREDRSVGGIEDIKSLVRGGGNPSATN